MDVRLFAVTPERFTDRRQAGRLLAPLVAAATTAPVVIGLARGGVVVAAEVARALGAELDALAVRKIGHPWQPEYAIGAVAPGGEPFLRSADGLTPAQVAAAAAQARVAAARLDEALHARYARVPVAGREVVLVDDGLATGATMVAACRWARAEGAARIVVAVPAAPTATVEALRREADEVVAIHAVESFGAVGFWYERFDQVDTDGVLRLLDAAREPAPVDEAVEIPADGVALPGDLTLAAGAAGLVVFAHGSGSSRRSTRNRQVASTLQQGGLGTLLFDLLTHDEAADRANVFDVPLLARRLAAAVDRALALPGCEELPVGLFGASTGAAAALWAAADLGPPVRAVVSRGGRPDLAATRLRDVRAPTLLVVGGADPVVLDLNRQALDLLRCERRLEVVPGATHLFEEPGTLERVADLARDWFLAHLGAVS
jgi:predicted phosphoribosyltransferase/alpha-beta hydrolase superfamily lysophospholipase